MDQPSPAIFASLPVLAVAFSIWLLENRRKATHDAVDGWDIVGGFGVILRLWRELAIFVVGAFVVLGLFCNGQDLGWSKEFYATHNAKGELDPNAAKLNDRISAEHAEQWPLIGCADSLFAMQAMLRLFVALSASWRCVAGEELPIAGIPSLLFFLASVCRVVILCLSPYDVFYLDGPLGGFLNVAFEVAVLLPLIHLACVSKLRVRSLLSLIGVLLLSLAIADANVFKLAYDEIHRLDTIFSLVQILDALGAILLLWRSVSVWSRQTANLGIGSVVVHTLMPLQHIFAAYFFLVAFNHGRPLHVQKGLVHRGCPFELMWTCGLVQVASCLAASALYFSACTESKGKEPELARTGASESRTVLLAVDV